MIWKGLMEPIEGNMTELKSNSTADRERLYKENGSDVRVFGQD